MAYKYNYKGASALWDKYYDLCVEPWTCGDTEKQEARRDFLRALTHGEDVTIYTDYVQECLDNIRPVEDAKSRCYDFELEKKYTDLIEELTDFYGLYGIIRA